MTTVVDLVADQLLGLEPARLYDRAAYFDEVNARLATIADGLRAVLRGVESAWQPHDDRGSPPGLGERPSEVLRQLDQLQSPEPAAALRRAGDSLAQAQVEVRELRARRQADITGEGPHPADERAIALLDRLSSEFAEAGGRLLALPLGPADATLTSRAAELSTMDLTAAVEPRSTMDLPRADGLFAPAARRDVPPGGAGGLGGGSLASSLPDTSNGGQPMMPFMPMGMGGMGAMGQTGGRDRQPGGQGSAEPGAWQEPDDGWEVVGRNDSPGRVSREDAERAATRAIDALLRGNHDPAVPRRQ